MSAYTIDIRPGAWVLRDGAWSLEATGIIRDRGTIRCTLSVSHSGKLVYRDNANLTGDRSRDRILKRLAEALPTGTTALEAGALLALDDAIRQTPREPSPNGHNNADTMYDTPSDFSCKVTNLTELEERISRALVLKDKDVLPILMGAVIAHRLGGESPWLLIVAPSSGTKTELLRSLYQVRGMYPLSELTARTFASGLDIKGGSDPSLLARLSNEILVVKDLTTVLEMSRDERQAVLAQLRELYDGQFDKVWGTGKEVHWRGRLGFVAGVTPVIDQYHTVMGMLGPRFLLVRLEKLEADDRKKVAKKAMGNAHPDRMRADLAAATSSYLATIGDTPEPPTIPDAIITDLASLADLVTSGRSPVIRDGYKREFEYAPEPESPARFARQLHALLQGVTLALGLDRPNERAVKIITRVALDCVPAIRRLVLRTLYAQPEGEMVKTTAVAQSAQYSSNTIRFALEDLQALGLTVVEKGGAGAADLWGLSEHGRAMMDTLHEMLEGCHTNSIDAAAPIQSTVEDTVAPASKNGYGEHVPIRGGTGDEGSNLGLDEQEVEVGEWHI